MHNIIFLVNLTVSNKYNVNLFICYYRDKVETNDTHTFGEKQSFVLCRQKL